MSSLRETKAPLEVHTNLDQIVSGFLYPTATYLFGKEVVDTAISTIETIKQIEIPSPIEKNVQIDAGFKGHISSNLEDKKSEKLLMSGKRSALEQSSEIEKRMLEIETTKFSHITQIKQLSLEDRLQGKTPLTEAIKLHNEFLSLKGKRERILKESGLFALPIFKEIHEEGFSYRLFFGKEEVKQGSRIPRSMGYDLPRSGDQLVKGWIRELLTWSGKKEAEIKETDPVVAAQVFLGQVNKSQPMTLTNEEKKILRERKETLNIVPESHMVRADSDNQGPYIRSEKIVERKDVQGKVLETLNWVETLRVQGSIQVQRDVK